MKKRSIVLLLTYIFYEKKVNSTTVDLIFYKKKVNSTTVDLYILCKKRSIKYCNIDLIFN